MKTCDFYQKSLFWKTIATLFHRVKAKTFVFSFAGLLIKLYYDELNRYEVVKIIVTSIARLSRPKTNPSIEKCCFNIFDLVILVKVCYQEILTCIYHAFEKGMKNDENV